MIILEIQTVRLFLVPNLLRREPFWFLFWFPQEFYSFAQGPNLLRPVSFMGL